MVKIDLITGFLGSGKTTFIKKYAKYLIDQGENIGILENDYGAVNVDMMLLKDLEGENCELEMIAGGTVSFSDMYGPQMNVEAVGESGMKANVTRPILSAEPNETPEQSYRMREAIEHYEKYNNTFNGRVLIDYCIHAEYTCDERTARVLIDEMNAHNGNLHIHLSETKKEHDECIVRHGKTPAEWFDSLGAFESSAFAAHCVWLSESDMELFRRKGVSVVHNPTSNMKLASGFAPVLNMFDMVINVAIGTD